MTSGGPSTSPYEHDNDLIDPDDADINDLDDPLEAQQQPLTGTIQSDSSRRQNTQNYLNSSIQGEDRRAPINTIDESVWDTLSRDLNASWQKMKLVLWPKHLFGGLLQRESGLGGAERGEAGQGLTDGLRGIAGRLQNADTILQGQISDELRDWDLWGPLVFSLLLSLLLSWSAVDWKDEVFTSVFAMSWVGTMVVTTQIRLLGGKIAFFQTVCIIGYTLFPLVIAALLSAIGVTKVARIPVDIVMLLWAFAAGVSILGGSGVVKNRVGLAVYPLFVFYLALGTLCIIS
ncbi:MAG: hypothetical protein MMC23_007646 [Stictis urceolatum]|nr:hypothetical protein [Stictis urceolata]